MKIRKNRLSDFPSNLCRLMTRKSSQFFTKSLFKRGIKSRLTTNSRGSRVMPTVEASHDSMIAIHASGVFFRSRQTLLRQTRPDLQITQQISCRIGCSLEVIFRLRKGNHFLSGQPITMLLFWSSCRQLWS